MRGVEDSEDSGFSFTRAFDSMPKLRIEIDAVAWLQYVGMVFERDRHLSFEHKDEFLAFMRIGVAVLPGGRQMHR